MLRNYLTVAFRNLVHNKLYSIINIGGLTVGLAACLLIVLFVQDERSYERWLPNADRIAAVETTFFIPGREQMGFAAAPGPVQPALAQDFSTDVEKVVRIFGDEEPAKLGDRTLLGQIAYVDPGFFDVFDLPMLAGDRERALADTSSILLEHKTAQKFFGDQPAIGQTITVAGTKVFTVVGVFADLPRNTHLDLPAIARFEPARYKDRPYVADSWTSVNTRTYALFRSHAAIARVAAALPAFVDRHADFKLPGVDEKPSTLLRLGLRPIRDIHLHAGVPGYDNVGSFTAVVAFAGIALLILVIACINFVNLATARAMKRAREVAMRKVVGATRVQLVGQHLGEAVITALIALVFALALVELSLAPFNAFLHKQLRLHLLGDPTLLVTSLALVVAVGLIGGLYPAVYLSRFRPAAVLKANQSSAGHGSSALRTGLVVFQFAISIALIVCTATIYSQTVYARTLDLGFVHHDRMTLAGIGDLPNKDLATTLKAEIAALPAVRGVSLSSDTPPLHNNNNTLFYPTATPGDEKLIVETLRVDPDFFTVYGVQPLAGRLFSADRPTDFQPDDAAKVAEPRQSIVVNQAFLAKLGVARAEDAVGKVLYEVDEPGKPMLVTTIIGVVPDLYLRSARSVVTPLSYFAQGAGGDFNRLTVQVAPGAMRQTLKAVEASWTRLAPGVPFRPHFVDQELSVQYDADEQRGEIFAGFAVFAVLIACLGLFGLASFAAERRTKEIGMRKVLGASVFDIVRLLVWQFSRPVLAANLIAWPVSFYVMQRWLHGFQHRISLTEPKFLVGIFGGAALLALAIAWLTTAGHAYRVARSSPSRALRVE
ncbi:MAG TPA: ABC transporter permease [Kofleriaceae bacterium]|nr:ABC transporter permease [Kofleriaceae bacterium]